MPLWHSNGTRNIIRSFVLRLFHFLANTLLLTLPSLKRCVCAAGSCGGQGVLLSYLRTVYYCAFHHAPWCSIMFHHFQLSIFLCAMCPVRVWFLCHCMSLSHSAQEALLDPVQRAAAQSAASTSFKAPKAGTATMDCTAWTPTYDLCQKHSKAIVMLCSVPHHVL